MQHDPVLLLIDTYLERLQKVRQLLSEVAASPDVTLTMAPEAATGSKRLSPQTAGQQVATVRVIEPGDSPRKKRNTMRKKKTAGMEPLFAAPITDMNEITPAAPALIAEEPMRLEVARAEKAAETSAALPTQEAVVEVPAAPQPLRVRARLQRAMRVVKRRSNVAPSTALVGTVPAGPVFISAEKVRQQKSERQPEAKSRNAPEAPAAKPLTAEMLAQRWIQSPAW